MDIKFIDLNAQYLQIGDKIQNAVSKVVASGQYILGDIVKSCESDLSRFCGAKHSISCANGTDALQLVLMAWGIGRGDGVLVPSFTFAATAEVVALVGATPIFVDVLEDDFTIDPEHLERTIIAEKKNNNFNLKAIIPVDLFGHPADYDRILAIAERYNLKVLSDSAQGFGGLYNGRRTGVFGQATTTSFFPAKPLGCYGDGGAIFTDDDNLAMLLTSLRMHGQGVDKYDNIHIGLNSRLDNIQAAILIEKLAIFEDEIIKRQQIAGLYTQALEKHLVTPTEKHNCSSIWSQYTIKVKNRDKVKAALNAENIPTMVYYAKPLHQQIAYNRYPVGLGQLPVTDKLAGEVLSLPMHPYLSWQAQTKIIQVLRDATKG